MQQQHQNQQQQQINKEDELRQTLKRGPPKINSHKLPSAFGNVTNPIKKNKQKNQLFINQNSNPQQQNNEVRNIEEIVDIQQFKQAQNLLSPIKNDVKKQKVKQQSQSNKNPLGPIRRYMINYTKVNEEINSQNEFSMDKINKLAVNKSMKNHNSHSSHDNINQHNIQNQIQQQQIQQNQIFLLTSKLKLEEMITLSLMKGNRDTGLIKKMLHAPTLQLYAIKEEPISNKEVRQNLKEWISFWQNQFQDSELHIKVYASFWNTPEGCVSILQEHVGGGSLQNLLESVGCLNERALKEICQQILGSLQILHIENQVCHGQITPSQILFTREGNVKLSLGISYRVNPVNNQFTSLGKVQDRMSLYDPSSLNQPNLFNKQYAYDKQNNSKYEELQKSEDIFKLGILVLISAVGNIDILDNHSIFMENLKFLLEDIQKNPNNYPNVCCIIHSENLIYSVNNKNNTNISDQNITINKLLSQGRFSQDFMNFMCECTQLQTEKRQNVEKLLSHPFITQRKLENKSPKIYLRDLIKISSHWSQQESLPLEYQGASEKQLNRLVDALSLVLPNCEKWYTNVQYSEYVRHLVFIKSDSLAIDTIATDLGIDPQIVLDKILSVYASNQFFQDFVRRQKKIYQQQI